MLNISEYKLNVHLYTRDILEENDDKIGLYAMYVCIHYVYHQWNHLYIYSSTCKLTALALIAPIYVDLIVFIANVVCYFHRL